MRRAAVARSVHDDLGVAHDVVDDVRVERRAHLGGARLHLRDEAQQRAAVVRLGEALARHEAATLELGVGVEEAVGCDELDARGVFPPPQQLAQEARHRRLADGDRSGDTDDEGRAVAAVAEKRVLRAA
jgi:hypothetical protein